MAVVVMMVEDLGRSGWSESAPILVIALKLFELILERFSLIIQLLLLTN
jgi:hypothetical protein